MWSVENGVVICSSSKDYELQSWNEQGEITKIEGMLTIAFSYISSCSHTDSRKQLYLIMKIPYRVSMSTEQKIEPKRVELQPVNLLKAFHEQRDEIEKLKSKIDTLEKANSIYEEKIGELEKKLRQVLEEYKKQKEEIEILKKENLRLKILSGETKSGWRQDRNMIERDNPITGKLEYYDCPVNFKHELVSKKKYLDENRLKVEFYHNGNMNYDRGYFPMATDAYLWLCGELPEQRKKEKKQILKKDRLIKFDSPESLLQYFEEKLGKEYYSHSLIDVFVPFIFENIKKQFGRKDACEYCKSKRGKKPCDATVHKHLNLLIKHNIIFRKHKGIYEVIKQSINYD